MYASVSLALPVLMGSSGARPRKRRHALAKLPDSVDQEELTPPVMWPAQDSGFEASPFSPAGAIQRFWWGIRATSRRNKKASRLSWVVVWVIPIAVIVIGIVGVAISLAQ